MRYDPSVELLDRRLAKTLLSTGAIIAAAMFLRYLQANATTAALTLNLFAVAASVWGRFRVGAVAALTAGLCFNFFFLQPYGTFHISRAEDLFSFVLFLFGSAITSHIVTLSLSRAERANARENEVNTLYELAVSILSLEAQGASLDAAIRRAIESLNPERGGYVEMDHRFVRQIGWIGGDLGSEQEQRVRTVRIHRQLLSYPVGTGRDYYVPVTYGADVRGCVVLIGTTAAQPAVEAISMFVTLALEREDLVQTRMHVDALRESEQLRTSFFRAVSHDLTTPLTAISLNAEALQRILKNHPDSRTAVTTLLQESRRLRRRIQNLLSIAKLEAGKIKLSPEPTPPADLFRTAAQNLRMLSETRTMNISVADACGDAFVDPLVANEVLTNLIENADRASSDKTVIELTARDDGGWITMGVLDRGSGIHESSSGVFELDDLPQKGLGLEIVRSFVELSGGKFRLEPRDGGGTSAWVSFPKRGIDGIDSGS